MAESASDPGKATERAASDRAPLFKHVLARPLAKAVYYFILAIGPLSLIVFYRSNGGIATWAPREVRVFIDLLAMGAILLASLWCRGHVAGLSARQGQFERPNSKFGTMFKQFARGSAEADPKRFALALPLFIASTLAVITFWTAQNTLHDSVLMQVDDASALRENGYLIELPFNLVLEEVEGGHLSGRVLRPLWMDQDMSDWAANEESLGAQGWWAYLLSDSETFPPAVDAFSGTHQLALHCSSVLLTSLFLLVVFLGTTVYGLLVGQLAGLAGELLEP